VPSAEEIVRFDDAPPPQGESPWVVGAGPMRAVAIVASDPRWPERFRELAGQIRTALGPAALGIEHVDSTAVPGLAAKPVIDIDLTVADPADEASYVPALEHLGYRLVIREPWWYGHRCLRCSDPWSLLHVFGPDCPEAERHIIFRDWLTHSGEDRALYGAAKAAAMEATRAAGGHVMDYNAAKQSIILEIYARAFAARGLL
jgi:GrpB-like predicted nucleotidyltransferase (UPF0157 family)